jgi:hypothetical protein
VIDFSKNFPPDAFDAHAHAREALKRGALVAIANGELAKEGALNTRELALRVVRAKGLDECDKVLRHGIMAQAPQTRRLTLPIYFPAVWQRRY